MTTASTARITIERHRMDTSRPPLTRDLTIRFDVARSASSPGLVPGLPAGPHGQLLLARKFRPRVRLVSRRNHSEVRTGRQGRFSAFRDGNGPMPPVRSRAIRAHERRNFRYTLGHGRSRRSGPRPDAHDEPRRIAQIAEQAGVSVPTVSKVINGRSDVARRDTPPRRGGDPRRAATSGRDARPAAAPLLEVIFHELESEWALEIVRGVERVAGQHHLAVVLSEMQGRRTPGRGWIEGVLARRPTGVIAVFSDLSRRHARAAAVARDPATSSSTRPASRSTTRHRSARRTGTAA